MKTKTLLITALIFALLFAAVLPLSALAADEPDTGTETEETAAEESTGMSVKSVKAIACAVMIALASTAGAISIALASGKASDGIARQPEAGGDIRSSLMLSLVFIETAIIYALLVVILVIFVL